MNKELHLNNKIGFNLLLCVGLFCVSISTFAQTSDVYNVVMNIYDDPKTKMAFNWFSPAAGGQVEIVKGTLTNHSEFNTPYKITISANSNDLPANKAIATGLSPGTTYSFRVGGINGNWSNIGTFTTAKDNKVPFSFIYTTDSQTHNFVELQQNIQLAFSNYSNTNFWLHCGDLINDGEKQGQWNQLFAAKQERFYHVPFVPIVGNHDVQYNNVNFSLYFNTENFGTVDPHHSTYTYIYGDAQFFAINSEWYGNDPNTYMNYLSNWMQDQVTAHPEITWRIVFFHKSAYSGTYRQVDASSIAWRKAIAPLFDDLGIDIAFFGHDHVYQLMGPVKNKQLVAGSVSNVQQGNPVFPNNVTGQTGGIFNVNEGTLFFSNGFSGDLIQYPESLESMTHAVNADVPDYPSLFTGRFGQNGHPTYSHVAVSTDNIVISTYEVVNGNSALLDKIKVVKYCEPYTQGIVTYNSTQSFNNTTLIIGDELRIKNNATVTFTNSTLRFYQNAKVVIEVGSKLVLNNTTLTNSCTEEMWQGITVNNQGVVELKNNATISNALCGIAAKNGGKVETYDAHFINNTTGVLCYLAGNCSFTLTDFKLSSSYFGNSAFEAHIKAQTAGNVKVTGCSFSSVAPIGGINLNMGIWASNTLLEVKEFCPYEVATPTGSDICPEIDRISNSFSGFNNGIYHLNGGALPTLKVRCSNFENCYKGIYVAGSNYPELLLNKFDVTHFVGLDLRSITGYKVEENRFLDSKHAPNRQSTGLRVYDSGSAENEVYKNYYENLSIGQQFSEKNSSQTDIVPCPNCPPSKGIPPPPVTGVQTLCNQFENNYAKDIFISQSASIRKNQGSDTSPAGNRFLGSTPFNIDNALSQHSIEYYYGSFRSELPNMVSPNVTLIRATLDNSCPSKIGSIIINPQNKGEGGLEQSLISHISHLISLHLIRLRLCRTPPKES